MNENERMAELLLPGITKTPDYYEELYKPRNLPEGARVTRVAPSPTAEFSTPELRIPTKSARLRAVLTIL